MLPSAILNDSTRFGGPDFLLQMNANERKSVAEDHMIFPSMDDVDSSPPGCRARARCLIPKNTNTFERALTQHDAFSGSAE